MQGAHSEPRFHPVVRATGGLIVLGIIVTAYGIHAAMGREAAFSWIAGAVSVGLAADPVLLSLQFPRLFRTAGTSWGAGHSLGIGRSG